jgi:hypothetical protein
MNIVTSICVDEKPEDDSYYPNANRLNQEQRRILYWKCVVVFFCSSVRCNPKARHIVFSNDRKPVMVKGKDMKEFLKELGVEVRYLPFQYFKSREGTTAHFRNAFYKLDVIKELGSGEYDYNLLLDSDCVFSKPDPQLMKLIQSDEGLLLYDVYEAEPSRKIHNINRYDMGEMYNKVWPGYPKPDPILYGGEFLAGSGKNFRIIADEMYHIFTKIQKEFGDHPPKFPTAEYTILDADEHISSLVYNKMSLKLINAKGYVKRIWTDVRSSRATMADFHTTIWHLPREKSQGLPVLFNKVIDKQSSFWTTPLDTFNVYLGKYLGVPKRTSFVSRYKFLFKKAVKIVRYNISKKLKVSV